MKKSVFFISANSSRVIPFFLFLLFGAAQLSAATWYIKPGGSDASAGNSWAAAYQTLTKALQSAASGDQIWVAAGTYKPTTGTDRTISFSMKNGVAILGGFPATGNPVLADRNWETHVTTLSGDIGTVGDNSDNSYHVVYSASLNNTAILDGFVVTAGNANGPQPHDHGGGLKNASSSPTIQYCSFYGNSAVSGGGVSNVINSSAIFNHCNFSNNSATSGGGMYNYISAPTVKNCSFSGNSGLSGGAAFNHTNGAPKFINCVFYSNTGASNGSAVSTTFSSVTLANCSFSGNSGGGTTITSLSSTATITNCNIWGNNNSIVDINGTTTVTYSNVQGGYTGTGNSNVNPLFVNAPGDLRLQACSPVINKGSDAAVPAGITTDFDDNNRFFGTVDMGAYEYQGNPPGLAAICKNITIALNATGNVSIPASAVDNGSTGCNLSMYLSRTNFNCSNVGANNLLFVVSDNNFHSSSCAVTVTVQDNTVPTAVCKNATVQLDATGNVTVPASAVDNGSTAACGIAALTLSKSNFNCSNVGNSLVSLEVQDNKGNKAYCSTTITVQDNVAPTALCKNATVQLDATGNATLPVSAVDNGSADACGIASLALSKTTFNCSNVGANTVTLTVTDNNGKSAACTATVTVQDNTPPVAVCKNAAVQLDAAGNATLSVLAVNNGSADACGVSTLTLSKTNFNCSNVGANTITLTVTDGSNNTSTCSATVTVQDNTLPTAVCKNATVQLDATGNVTVPASAVDNGSTDACGIAALTLSKTNFNCSNVGNLLVSLEVRDNNGNKAYCSTTLTIQDNIAPTAACQNATLQLDATGNATLAATAVNNGSVDACGIASLALSKTTFNCSNTGANTVTLTVTDNNGRTATCSASVTVQDNVAPTAVCQNATLQLDATGNATLAATAVNNGSADACGIASLALSKTTFDCSNTGANTVTLTVTDNNGRTATCSASVTVQDNVAPTAVCQNAVVQIDATGNATLTASAVNNGSADACGLASLVLSKTAFDCSNTGANTVTLTATDNNGRTATCSATVTVQDNVAPTAVCQNAVVQLDATGNATLAATAVNNGSADACGIASLVLSKTAFDCSNTGANTVTLTATDNNGKTATCSATVTVQDNVAPTVSCPQDMTVSPNQGNSCSAVPGSGLNALSDDNCTAGLTYQLTGATTGSGVAQVPSATVFFSGVTTVTYTATDQSQHSAQCVFHVTVGACGVEVSGKLIWENNNLSGVGNALVSLDGDEDGTVTTSASGTYAFPIDAGSDVTITPAKNTNKLNGVTSADATAIQQHVANVTPLPAPFKRIAADVNKSNSITTMDVSIINQALLGNPAALNQITSWRFVPAAYNFSNPNMPWGFPEQIDLTDVSGSVSGQDFKGIKLGDVVSTWANPANFGAGEPLVFRLQDQVLEAGSEVVALFQADQLDDLNSFQFALQFDPEQLHLVEIEPLNGLPVSLDHFGTYHVAEGEIRVVWAQATSVLLSEAAPVFRLRFKALESGAKLSEVLRLNEEALPGHCYNSVYAASGVELRYSESTGIFHADYQSALRLDNYPNPFTGRTTLRFALARESDTELRITDAAGRLVLSENVHYAAGKHLRTLQLEHTVGVLWAELITPFGVLTRKLVAVQK